MGEKHEIGTKLTLDDAASHALHHIREGFEKVGEKVGEVGHEMMSMAKQAAAVAIGFQLNGMIESFHELGHEMIESASHLEDQKKELAGMISLADKGESSMDELSERAEKLNERFETLGITVGVSKASLIDAFEIMASRSTRGTEAAAAMTEKMAEAARVLPGGVTTLSAAFRDLEAGVVRPKNAIVQLIRQTGVAGGSAKQIAKGINAMFQSGQSDKVMSMAENAITRMSEKMKKVPQSFSEIVESMHGFREMFIETLGTPALRALVPQFERLKSFLLEHREEIEHWAHTMGEKVGEWATKAAELMKDGFEYLNTHADDIFKALEGGANALRSAVAFLVEHRQLLMGLAVAKLAAGPISGAAGMVPGLMGMAGKAVGTAGTGATAGLALVDVMVWQEVFRQASELERESGLTTTQTLMHLVGIGGSLSKASDRMLSFDATMRRFNETIGDVNAIEDVERFADSIEKLGSAAVEAGDMTAAAYEKMRRSTRSQVDEAERRAALVQQMREISGSMGTGYGFMSGERFGKAYTEMASANERAAVDSARRILTANDKLVQALGAYGVEDALKKLAALASGKPDGGDVKLPPINFGPTTMTIKQDFRDQDPDRIAVIFRNDITKHAVSRVAAKTGSPFGF